MSDTHLSISLIQHQSSPSPKRVSEQNGLQSKVDIDCRNRFHSDKICDISYANIQGKECLIEKFRNSCVMDEDPSYRPKIFHSTGSLMGQEQEYFSPEKSDFRFPEPNNARRKLRSIACARQIGYNSPHLLTKGNTDLWNRTFSPCCIEKDGSLNDFSFSFFMDVRMLLGRIWTGHSFL